MRKYWGVWALWGILGAILLRILMLNDGVFLYTLDDPYIHLQFSTQLARGHFGLLPDEIASPSSSILWPLLLVPFSLVDFHEFAPLAINILAITASFLLWRRVLVRFVLAGDHPSEPGELARASVLALLALITTNAVGLVFSGMEHSLQLTATLAALTGAIELIETGRIRWWLIAGIVTGPLLRYENVPVSATALLVMAASGFWLWSLLAGAAVIAGLGGFALVSLSAGLPPVPGSLRVKTLVGQNPSHLLSEIRSLMGHFVSYMLRGRWIADGLVLIGLLLARPFLAHEKFGLKRGLFLGGILGIAGAQLIFGAHYNQGRYDCYAFNASLLGIAYFYRTGLRKLSLQTPGWRLFAGGAFIAIPLLLRSSGAFLLTPLAAQDIYRQQWQMQRYLRTLADEGVAVHDVGIISYYSGQRVLDLIGLGSEEVRQRQSASDFTPQEAAAFMRQRKINAVLVPAAEQRFKDMERVAVFHLGREIVSVATREVVLYAIDAAAAARLRQKAIDFAPTMPAGSRLEIIPAR